MPGISERGDPYPLNRQMSTLFLFFSFLFLCVRAEMRSIRDIHPSVLTRPGPDAREVSSAA
ncbi:hypothetical protein LX32DRAFT_406360 [Colletotrichum zoysiae]|uniref:Uncharacterized protein n=1 Tax=Colletotrichum zoysiae TaxID=1216348 RepID=A0AAD9M413_9PEZI|nr:hypothetical protein LX32DRAFT_406360 [Colletotrichum zoysiae]